MTREINKEVKERVVLDLLAGVKAVEINKTYGLNQNTITQWKKKDEEFQTLYKEAAEDVLDSAMANLKGLVGESVERLRVLVQSEDLKISLEAIKLVLNAYKFKEIEPESMLENKELKENAFIKAFGDV